MYHLTRRSTVRLLQELLGLRISTGSVSNLERSMSAAVEPAVDEAWAEALDLPRVCGPFSAMGAPSGERLSQGGPPLAAQAQHRVGHDITFLWTWEGWVYLAVIVDLCSRRVVGWAAADHMRTELVASALQMALGRRCPDDGLLHHSDRGSQYRSGAYRKQLRDNVIVCSMSRKANCWNNAVAESFFATIKKEQLIYRRPWTTGAAVGDAIADYIEMFYNPQRRHSALGYLSPAEFERREQPMVILAA